MAYGQTVPPLAAQQARALRQQNNLLARLIHRLWKRTAGNDFDESVMDAIPLIMPLVERSQANVIETAAYVVPRVMDDIDGKAHKSYGVLREAAWLGLNGDGQPLQEVLADAAVAGKQAVAAGCETSVALQRIERKLTTMSLTCVSDTQRSAASVTGHLYSSRPQYIRVLNPPSCARCVILAGTTGGSFARHPNCDCTFICADKVPSGAYSDPHAYLDDLDDTELARVLGSKANAQAYRDGADLTQLVNAYRRKCAVSSAQMGRMKVKYTTEGMSKRGVAYRRMKLAGMNPSGKLRLMPETIYKVAEKTGADPRQLLQDYGWIRR